MVCSGYAIRLATKMVRLPAACYHMMSLGKSFTHMSLYHQEVYFVAGQRAVLLCSRLVDDFGSGVASVMGY